MKWCRDPRCSPRGNPACRRTFAVASRVSITVSHLRTEHGTSLETPGTSVFPWTETGMLGNFWGSHEGCQGPFCPSGRNKGLPLRRCHGQGPHLAKRWEPGGVSRVAAGFSSYEGDLSLPLGLALGSPIFPSGCEGKLGVALESLQGRRDLT